MQLAGQTETRRVEDFFQANLAAFKRSAPYLYSRLSAVKRPNTELIADPDNGIDIAFQGLRLYERNAVDHANARLELFFRAPEREYIRHPDPAALQGMTGDYCEALIRGLAEREIRYDPARAIAESHFLVVLGVGLGLHIPTLIGRVGAKVVVLIEPHIEFLYQSLFVTDWTSVFDDSAAQDVRISIIVEKSPQEIAGRTQQVLRGNNPALLDGISFYTDYHSAILQQAKDEIRQNLFLSLAGLGFFDDEIIMCRNAVGNFGRGRTKILGDFLEQRDEPVLVIGSGPSVEADLDFIADHADRAVLISIGTGLRALLERGVKPDFHVELENGTVNRDIMAMTAKDFDLGGITLVAAISVHPGLVNLFDHAILVFRERITPTGIFAGSFKILQPAGPTVANAALIAAIHLGFREIYLFGVDMGTKVKGKFHAKGSVYGAGLRAEVAKPSRSFPGNFGGVATGSHLFDWSRKVLENALSFYRTVKVYNCSDGARIEGAIPKVRRAVELPRTAIDRPGLHGAIGRGLSVCHPEDWIGRWRAQDLSKDAESTFGELDRILADAVDNAGSGMSWVHDICDAVGELHGRSPIMASYLSGTLLISVGCASWFDRRIDDPVERRSFRTFAIAEFQTLVGAMRKQLGEQFDQVEAILGGAAAPA